VNARELYAAMCAFAEEHGYYRRSPDEGGWWDHEDGGGDMTIGELCEEEFLRQKIDTRRPA
jgi:hypothetical protein